MAKDTCTFTCECGEKVEARSHRAYQILFNPMVGILWILLSLCMSLLIDWLIMENLCHYGLQHVHEALSDGRYFFLYTITLLMISGWFIFNIISEEQQSEARKNGIEIFYGRCKCCGRKRRFVKHTTVNSRPWVEPSLLGDDEFGDN